MIWQICQIFTMLFTHVYNRSLISSFNGTLISVEKEDYQPIFSDWNGLGFVLEIKIRRFLLPILLFILLLAKTGRGPDANPYSLIGADGKLFSLLILGSMLPSPTV
ncbi:hypothetical protein [Pedobacter ginsengisoli]|nr:hypothetical protein [Pedobacter ginsengisoli]